MDWQELVLEIDAARLSMAEEILATSPCMAVTLTDAGDHPVLEPLPGHTPLWPQIRLKALFESNVDRVTIEQLVRAELPDMFLQWRQFKDEQWERVCLEHLAPTKFGERLWIIPSHCQPPDPNACNIDLDPGLAFGTGGHATTRLCLEWLEQSALEHNNVLDYGHGSGVLAIAACRLGATSAVGIDIDPQALVAGRANADQNNVGSQIHFYDKDIDQKFEIVVANILAAPLISLAQTLADYLSTGGNIALSGILDSQGAEVERAFHPWIEWRHRSSLDGWMLISGTRTHQSSE